MQADPVVRVLEALEREHVLYVFTAYQERLKKELARMEEPGPRTG